MEKLFSVKDNKAHSFGKVMQFKHEVEATRMLNRVTNDPNTQLSFTPEDYDLYELGEYDPSTGVITVLPQPKFIVGAISFKKQTEENYHGE